MNNSSSEVLTRQVSVIGISPPDCQSVQCAKSKPQQILVGWDRQKSYTFMALSICFLVWACVFFPIYSN